MVKLIATIIATVLCAFAYRFGGCSKEEGKAKFPWAPSWLFRSWVRDFFCSLIPLFWLRAFYPYVNGAAYGTTFILSYAAHTTYWDKIFGYDNFYIHGIAIGLSYILFPIFSGIWVGFILRTASISLIMGIVSAVSSDADVEEFTRGAVTGITLPMLLI